MIATALHKLIELVTADDAGLFAGLQHYVITDSVLDMMKRSDVQASIEAMVDAEMGRLPYPSILIETTPAAGIRRFVALSETGGDIQARTAALYREKMATVSARVGRVHVTRRGIDVSDAPDGNDAMAIGLAAAMALLLLNTRGIEKDVITSAKLNKARVASGKPPIPQHAVLRIGTIYASDGSGEGEAFGRSSPSPHLRAGHARNQACGPAMSDRRIIYIPPVVVGGSHDAVRQPRVRMVAR